MSTEESDQDKKRMNDVRGEKDTRRETNRKKGDKREEKLKGNDKGIKGKRKGCRIRLSDVVKSRGRHGFDVHRPPCSACYPWQRQQPPHFQK